MTGDVDSAYDARAEKSPDFIPPEPSPDGIVMGASGIILRGRVISQPPLWSTAAPRFH